MFTHSSNIVGTSLVVVTLYPIIPLASSVAFICILFVPATISVTTGFSLSIFVISLLACPFDWLLLSTILPYIVWFSFTVIVFTSIAVSGNVPSLLSCTIYPSKFDEPVIVIIPFVQPVGIYSNVIFPSDIATCFVAIRTGSLTFPTASFTHA